MSETNFFVEHAALAAVIVNGLVVVLVTVTLAFIRREARHNDRHQNQQDDRIGRLEERVGIHDKENSGTAAELRHVVDRLDLAAQQIERYRKENKDEHKEIKDLIRQKQEPAPA